MTTPRIMVVDDDPVLLDVIGTLLEDEGYCTTTQTSSAEALRAVQCARPDLMIVDVRLRTSGCGAALIEQLRREPATRQIPVLLCTADKTFLRERSQWCQERDITVLTKPFDLAALLDLVQTLAGSPGARRRA